jgi:hypothetical protein
MSRSFGASIGAIAFAALVLLGRPAVAADDPEAEDGGAEQARSADETLAGRASVQQRLAS